MAIRKSINREIIVETKQEVLTEQTATYPTPAQLKKLNNAKANYINGLKKRKERVGEK